MKLKNCFEKRAGLTENPKQQLAHVYFTPGLLRFSARSGSEGNEYEIQISENLANFEQEAEKV